MAEQMVVVCDVCGGRVSETVTIRLKDRSLVKDLCSAHLAELVKGTRRPRRGRKPGSRNVGSVRATVRTAKSATARNTTARTRPRRRSATSAVAAS